LIQRLQQPNISIESVLEKFQSEVHRYPARSIQLAAVRYYLGYMLSQCQDTWTRQVTKGVTNYKTLLDEIAFQKASGDKVCLVTFNYDTLLEKALVDIGVPLGKIADYIASDYKLIKLHGSIDWAHQIRNLQTQRSTSRDLIADIINSAPSLDVDSESYEIVSENPLQRPPKPLFPALAIPVENKQNYECPEQHRIVLEDCLPQVTKLLIIGWRANDSLFVETMAKGLSKDARIMVVSGSGEGANEVIVKISARLRAAGHTGDFLASKPGFSNFIFDSEWEHFLRGAL